MTTTNPIRDILHGIAWILVALIVSVCALLPLAVVALAGLVCGMIGVGAATLCAFIAKGLKTFAPGLLLLALVGCGVREARVDSFVHWVRFYEARMGLPAHEIRIGEAPRDACAWIGFEIVLDEVGPVLAGPLVIYNPSKSGCRPPWAEALHEMCHDRMAHPYLSAETREAMGIDAEAEAKTCEVWYAPTGRSL